MMPTYLNQWLERKDLNGNILEKQLLEASALQQKAERDLKRAEMRSPIDGTILKRYIKNERYLVAGTMLLDIGNLDDLQVTADILSRDVVNISNGNIVEISGAAIGEQSITGKVLRVKPQGFTKVSSLGVDQQRVPVVITLDKNSLQANESRKRQLGNEYRIQVKIFTATKKDVLKIPRTALVRSSSGRWQVYKIVNSQAITTNIDIGLINNNEVEVIKGLNVNDQVIVAPPVTITDNTPVKATK